jgi:hypothetical protein
VKKIGAVILPTVAEQMEAGDPTIIDPDGVDLTEWADPEAKPRPLFAGGRYRVPEDVVGWWTNPRVEDGRLVVDIELNGPYEDGEVRFSFSGLAGGGQARLIAVHAHETRLRPRRTVAS